MSYGQFRLVSQDDPEYLAIINAGGRKAQEDAVQNPTPYDDETAELLSWFEHEKANRSLRGVA